MEDSSDDEKPLGARRVVAATVNLLRSDSDSGSPVPEWISQATPSKTAIPLDEDSDDLDLTILPTQAEAPTQAPEPAKDPKRKEAKVKQSIAAAFAKAKPKAAGPQSQSLATSSQKLAQASQQLPPAGAPQTTKPVSAVPDAAPGAEIPLMFPEKLQGSRYLVELEDDSHGVSDLAGDAGAVGRFTIAGGAGKEKDMLLDLKGRIYNTYLVQCATTFCVVNLQPNEARVEAVLDQYVSLVEDENQNQVDNKSTFMYDDDDAEAYQVGEDDKQSQRPGKRKAKEEASDAPKPKKKAPAKPATAKRKPAAKKAAPKGGKKK